MFIEHNFVTRVLNAYLPVCLTDKKVLLIFIQVTGINMSILFYVFLLLINLPFQDIASNQLSSMPLDHNYTRMHARCRVTSRPRGRVRE